jgi:hypothetical protein
MSLHLCESKIMSQIMPDMSQNCYILLHETTDCLQMYKTYVHQQAIINLILQNNRKIKRSRSKFISQVIVSQMTLNNSLI